MVKRPKLWSLLCETLTLPSPCSTTPLFGSLSAYCNGRLHYCRLPHLIFSYYFCNVFASSQPSHRWWTSLLSFSTTNHRYFFKASCPPFLVTIAFVHYCRLPHLIFPYYFCNVFASSQPSHRWWTSLLSFSTTNHRYFFKASRPPFLVTTTFEHFLW
jgi:hypothetical protein